MSVEELSEGLYIARCLGQTRTFNAANPNLAMRFAEKWLVTNLKEVVGELDKVINK